MPPGGRWRRQGAEGRERANLTVGPPLSRHPDYIDSSQERATCRQTPPTGTVRGDVVAQPPTTGFVAPRTPRDGAPRATASVTPPPNP
jgi:hypothetical protein